MSGVGDHRRNVLKQRSDIRQDAYDRGYDAGREAVLGAIVCSVCGFDHDRDESAACEGCEPIRLDEWVAKTSDERRA